MTGKKSIDGIFGKEFASFTRTGWLILEIIMTARPRLFLRKTAEKEFLNMSLKICKSKNQRFGRGIGILLFMIFQKKISRRERHFAKKSKSWACWSFKEVFLCLLMNAKMRLILWLNFLKSGNMCGT